MSSQSFQTILFDLDGTLADTAPDLAQALNHALQYADLPALDYAMIRPWVSHGAAYMLQHAYKAYGLELSPTEQQAQWQRLIDYYQSHIAEHTQLFPGMDEVLEKIESLGMTWGIVTNKPHYLTQQLLQALQLEQRSIAIVSGDTLPEKKPHPAPILYACEQADCQPQQCLYVGDAQRDIEAGQRAGTHTAAALFGYIDATDEPEKWGADYLLREAIELMPYIA